MKQLLDMFDSGASVATFPETLKPLDCAPLMPNESRTLDPGAIGSNEQSKA